MIHLPLTLALLASGSRPQDPGNVRVVDARPARGPRRGPRGEEVDTPVFGTTWSEARGVTDATAG